MPARKRCKRCRLPRRNYEPHDGSPRDGYGALPGLVDVASGLLRDPSLCAPDHGVRPPVSFVKAGGDDVDAGASGRDLELGSAHAVVGRDRPRTCRPAHAPRVARLAAEPGAARIRLASLRPDPEEADDRSQQLAHQTRAKRGDMILFPTKVRVAPEAQQAGVERAKPPEVYALPAGRRCVQTASSSYAPSTPTSTRGPRRRRFSHES